MCVVTTHKWSDCDHEKVTKQCWRMADEAQYRARRKRWRLHLNCFSRFDDEQPVCPTTYKSCMNEYLCPDCHPTFDQVHYASDNQLVGEQRGRVEQARFEMAIQEQARQEEEVRRQTEQVQAQAEHFKMRQQQLEEMERQDRKMQERKERELSKKAEAEQMMREAKERARRSAEQYGWPTTTARPPPAPIARKPVGSGPARRPVASSLPRYNDLPPVKSKTLPRPTQKVPAPANVARVPSGHGSSSDRQGSPPSIAHRRGSPVTPIRVPPPPGKPKAKSQVPKPKPKTPYPKLQKPVDAAHAQRQADRARGKKTYDPAGTGVELIDGEDGREYGVMKRGGVIKYYPYVGAPRKQPTMADFVIKADGSFLRDEDGNPVRKGDMPKLQAPKPKLQDPVDAAHAQRQADRARGKKTYDPVSGVELVDGEDGREYGAMRRGGVIKYYPYVGAPKKQPAMDGFILKADGSFLRDEHGDPIRKGNWRDIKETEVAAQVKPRHATEIAGDFVPTCRHGESDEYGEPLPSDDWLDDMARYN